MPLRIAFLVPDNRESDRKYDLPKPYFGTAPTALLEGFAELAKAEIDDAGPPLVSSFKSQVSSTEIHILSCTQKPVAAPEKLASNIWFHSLHVPKWGWLRSGYLGCILAVRKKLAEINPDLVHAQGTERECAISAVFARYPKLLTIHGNLRMISREIGFPPFSAMWFQSFLEGFAVPKFDGVVCISNYTKRAVEQEAKRTWVIPNAIDSAFFELGHKEPSKAPGYQVPAPLSPLDAWPMEGTAFFSGTRPSTPIILVVGTIEPRKNQINFLRALEPLAQKRDFEVRFFGKCGADSYGREFQSLVSERSWCGYGGVLDRVALREEFAGAAMLALPSLEDNCPMVVLEAMAAGVPVIGSRVGGIPDLIEDEVNGLLCAPRSLESMHDVVERLLNDPALANRLSAEAKKGAAEKHPPRMVALQHLQVYREVWKDGKQRSEDRDQMSEK